MTANSTFWKADRVADGLGEVGNDPYPGSNIEAPDAGRHIQVLQHIPGSHCPGACEDQRFLPEEPGTVTDIGTAVDEHLHQP